MQASQRLHACMNRSIAFGARDSFMMLRQRGSGPTPPLTSGVAADRWLLTAWLLSLFLLPAILLAACTLGICVLGTNLRLAVPDAITLPRFFIADEAVRRLRHANERPETPLFLAVSVVKPYLPFCAPKRY